MFCPTLFFCCTYKILENNESSSYNSNFPSSGLFSVVINNINSDNMLEFSISSLLLNRIDPWGKLNSMCLSFLIGKIRMITAPLSHLNWEIILAKGL